MIKVQLAFSKNEKDKDKEFEIVKDELLTAAIDRASEGIELGEFKKEEVFNVVVNGHIIEKDFWDKVKLTEKDSVLITPKIGKGDAGQIFKQALIITISVVATVYLGPAVGGGIYGALAVAAVTVAATLALNALIPPPVPEGPGGLGGGREIDSSQMYSINGQSNQARRLGTVPKVYGIHRIFPNVAANPYTELSVDPRNGETIQYLYAIYDFGLGVMKVSDIKIGDTPLTTDSFRDFEYRLVDPNKPGIDEDEFDEQLEDTFKYYSTKRTVTGLSLALIDNSEFIQFSDENPDSDPQEIILDFVAPQGLYAYSSSGALLERSVLMYIEFALVGTDTWRPYNDLTYVENHSAVGGSDVTDFDSQIVATGVSGGAYYAGYSFNNGSYNNSNNINFAMYIAPGTKKMLVPNDSRFQVGGKVFSGNRFLGIIQTITPTGGNLELLLDRVITSRYDIIAYNIIGYQTVSGVPSYGSPTDKMRIRASRHESKAGVITAKKTAPVYGHFRFTPKEPGQYKIRVKRVSTIGPNGTQRADAITWGGLTTAFKRSPVNSDKRHVFLELKIKATNQLNGQIQNLSGVVSSVVPVYDPVTETWTRQVSNNPAWVFCDLLTGEVNKRAVPVSRLHMPSIVEWANYCDEVPTPPPSQTYLEPRFQCNFILDYDTTLQGVLGQIGSAAQASLNIMDGKYGVLVDRFKDTPVQIFTPRNSRDFNSTRLYGPRPHALKIKYIDPNVNWELSEVIAYDNGFNEENATEFDELTSFACTNYEQAWRFGRYMIAQNKLRQETISLLVDFENIVCTRGDYVQITQDVMRVGGTPCRVREVAGNVVTTDDSLDIDPDISYGYVYRKTSDGEILTSTLTPTSARTFEVDGTIPSVGDLIVIGEVGKIVYDCIVKSISPNDDLSANIVLIEKADEIFDYESSDTLPTYDPQLSQTSDPTFKPPKAVIDLAVTDNFWECNVVQSGYNYYVELLWDIPTGSVYEFFEVWVDDGRGYTKYDQTTSKLYRYNVDQTRLDIEHGFKVVAVSASGKKLELIAMPEVLTTPVTKVAPPSDVESLNMSITNQVMQLSWNPIADCDCAEYQIRFSPDSNDKWESSVPLATVAKSVTSVAVQARTGVYLIKAFDYNGNQSANAATALTTIPNLFDLNVVETINDAPTFDGTLQQVELLGEAVILTEEVPGDQDTVQYYAEGYYEYSDLLDLGDVYSVRLQPLIRADGLKKGELMSDWAELDDIDHLNSATSDDWDVTLQYRATDVFASMSDWPRLDLIDHINFGTGVGFTSWRDIATTGDATGRVFQFRVKLVSNTANVTPRLFDATVKADMPDRIDSFENLVSTASGAFVVNYDPVFKGPSPSPNVQISIDGAATGDYWTFDYKDLDGLAVRFYDKNGTQVARQFDLVAKGYGRRNTTTI